MELLVSNLTGRVRREKLQGREYLVAPVSMIVPGVLNGSQGPLLYTPEQIARDPSAWNGIPIVVYHPQGPDGRFISARHPSVIAKSGIGSVFSARVNNRGKLIGEGWFDVEHTGRVDRRVLNALLNGQPIELSTGLHTQNKPAKGMFNNVSYTAVAENYKPDHLAILPDTTGACSLKDGCGVNVNQKKKKTTANADCGTGAGGFKAGNDCAAGKGKGKKFVALDPPPPDNPDNVRKNRESMDARKRAKAAAIRKDNEARIADLRAKKRASGDVLDDLPSQVSDEEVARVRTADEKKADKERFAAAKRQEEVGKELNRRKRIRELPPNSPERIALREKKRKKLLDDFNKGRLPGPLDPKKLKEARATADKLRKLTGNTADECGCESCTKKRNKGDRPGSPTQEGKEPAMAKMTSNERKAVIDGLIGNCACEGIKPWAEEDRVILNEFSDDKLNKLKEHQEKVANQEKVAEAARKGFYAGDVGYALNESTGKFEPKVKEAEEPVANTSQKPMTDEEWMRNAPKNVRELVGNALKRERAHRGELITRITANKSNPFTAEELGTESTEKLEKLAKAFGTANTVEDEFSNLPSYFGAAAPLGNSRPTAIDKSFREEDLDMAPPVTNWAEEGKKREKATA